MKEIIKNLFIGDVLDCHNVNKNFSIIHACKTCHQKILGYKGSLKSNHPNYLIYQTGTNLFLNLVDMGNELLPKYTHPIMRTAIKFINSYVLNNKVLVHCNQGKSRSPSIVLLYLAIKKLIANSSYQEAKKDFITNYYFAFIPGRGIELYVNRNWNELLTFEV